MAFGVKHFETITGSIVRFFSGNNKTLTDFTIGSRLRTAFEAVAIELEQIYYQLYIGITDGIENGVYNSFNFSLLQASSASGSVRFSRNTPAPVGGITIPAGTQISTPGSSTSPAVIYQSADTVTILEATTYIDAIVVATLDGSIGNASANSITVLVGAPSGVDSVTNPNAFFTGRDLETADERRNRFLKYIDNLSRATLGAVETAALGVDGVVDAKAFESPKLSILIYASPTQTYTDISFEANLPSGAPIACLPPFVSTDDALYIGSDGRFDVLQFVIDQGMSGGAFTWEYWNGTAWVTLPYTTDSTLALRQGGFLTFTKPTNWRDSLVNSVRKFWIRLRVLTPSVSRIATIVWTKAAPLPGVIQLVAMNASATLTPSLRTAVSNAVEGYRAAGVRVTVVPPYITTVNVTANLKLEPLADAAVLQASIQQGISDYLAAFKLGQKLSLSEIIQFIENQSTDILDTVLTSPSDRIDASYDEVLRPGTITVVVQQ
jgi:uncharacterized phage protein gp47/JayE